MDGVLVMSYGTPSRLEEVEPYYTHIRRGNPPPPELLDELVERYEAVGGPTALNEITRQQADALGAELVNKGLEAAVFVGFKHVAPFIAEAVERMADQGVTRAIGLVMAPHYSLRSIAEYADYAERARPSEMALDVIPSWHDHPGFVDCLARRLRATLETIDASPTVLFTAHSVPASVVEQGDPYPFELQRTCTLIADQVGLDRWRFAYQSAGRTADPWLGPDILDVIPDLVASGEKAVVAQAIGFVADHLEILYDLDIEARKAADLAGLEFARTSMLNADPDFVAVLAEMIVDRLGR